MPVSGRMGGDALAPLSPPSCLVVHLVRGEGRSQDVPDTTRSSATTRCTFADGTVPLNGVGAVTGQSKGLASLLTSFAPPEEANDCVQPGVVARLAALVGGVDASKEEDGGEGEKGEGEELLSCWSFEIGCCDDENRAQRQDAGCWPPSDPLPPYAGALLPGGGRTCSGRSLLPVGNVRRARDKGSLPRPGQGHRPGASGRTRLTVDLT